MLTIAAIHYDDIYFAEVAQLVIDVIAELDDESCAVTIGCWAHGVEAELSPN